MRISDWSSDVCASDVPAGAVRLAHARRIDVQQRSDPRDPRGHVVAAGPVLGEPVVAEIDEAEAGQGVRTHVATRGERRFMTASVAWLALYPGLARKSVVWGQVVGVRVDSGGPR